MPTNSDTETYLDYYIDGANATDYAVMINAPWGAGKTYFIKEYIKKKSAQNKDLKNSRKYLLISLYGARSSAEISRQIFVQAHPIFSSRGVKAIGAILSRGLNYMVGSTVSNEEENASVLQQVMNNLEGSILIFDDFERSSMPIVDVMGFINSFVEHDKLKTILLANESEIKKKDARDYKRKKEKLVGKTLHVESDAAQVYEHFISEIPEPEISELLRRHSDDILQTFRASGSLNFRNLRSLIEDVERLFSTADSKLRSSPKAISELLKFMTALNSEFRLGKLTGVELRKLPERRQALRISRIVNNEASTELKYYEDLESRYPGLDWDNPVITPELLAELFEAGVVATKPLNRCLNSHRLVVGDANVPTWKRLWYWMDMSPDEYHSTITDLVCQLKNYRISRVGEILHAAGVVLAVQRNDHEILGDDIDPVEYFNQYIQEMAVRKELEPLFSSRFRDWDSYESLGYHSRDDDGFQEILETIQEAAGKMFELRMKEFSVIFQERCRSGDADYTTLYEHGIDEDKYGDIPFLHYLDPSIFAKNIVSEKGFDSKLIAALCARFEFERDRRRLEPEYEWLKSLRKQLEELILSVRPPHKRYYERNLSYYFAKIDKSVALAE